MDVSLSSENTSGALVANIPIKRMKRLPNAPQR